ncbi:hypothetical protein F8M41_005895 [Gigaspora margarita]|uniref:Uncharacterized protein n=1 Tax=Gigaspora margarita TaxID=4874 RepID=A0A8H4AX25_GIGMA|nr:hypothetical protein F8M41_005895 [Gigaspora margarita]
MSLLDVTFAKTIIEIGEPRFCAFDLNKKEQVDIKQLEIYWCAVAENSHALVGLKEIEWKRWKNKDDTIYKGQDWDKDE